MTIKEIENWLKKLEIIKSKGAKILHIRNLLTKERAKIIKIVEKMKKDEAKYCDFEPQRIRERIREENYNQALQDLLDILKL